MASPHWQMNQRPIGYASGGLLPNCLTVAIPLLLRDAHTVERIGGYGHRAFCDCGIVRVDVRNISRFVFAHAPGDDGRALDTR
jgi:hypothetical protein